MMRDRGPIDCWVASCVLGGGFLATGFMLVGRGWQLPFLILFGSMVGLWVFRLRRNIYRLSVGGSQKQLSGGLCLAEIAHELRTPITIIRGFAETLRDHDATLSAQMRIESIEKMIANCQRMERLIDALLRSAQLDLRNEELGGEEYDLLALVKSSAERLALSDPHVQVTIACPQGDQVSVWGYPDLLELAIFNLLANGARYSQEGGHLKVEIEAQRVEIVLRVRDWGRGIAADELTSIFDRFYRVGVVDSRSVGGLGLAIVNKVVQFHGGTVQVESKLGEGSCFCLTLPREKSAVSEGRQSFNERGGTSCVEI